MPETPLKKFKLVFENGFEVIESRNLASATRMAEARVKRWHVTVLNIEPLDEENK